MRAAPSGFQILGPLLLVTCLAALPAQNASAQVNLIKVAIAGGATESSAANYNLRGTVGESVVGYVTSANFLLGQGFWAGHFNLSSTGVPEVALSSAAPPVNRLFPSHPNPFRSLTTFGYSVAEEAPVSLRVFDVTGRRVATVVDQRQTPGVYRIEWDGRGDSGQRIANGVFFYRLTVGDWTRTRQVVKLK